LTTKKRDGLFDHLADERKQACRALVAPQEQLCGLEPIGQLCGWPNIVIPSRALVFARWEMARKPCPRKTSVVSDHASSALVTGSGPGRWHRAMLMTPLEFRSWVVRAQFRVAARQNRQRAQRVPIKAHI
jgi:hypothetical protein